MAAVLAEALDDHWAAVDGFKCAELAADWDVREDARQISASLVKLDVRVDRQRDMVPLPDPLQQLVYLGLLNLDAKWLLDPRFDFG